MSAAVGITRSISESRCDSVLQPARPRRTGMESLRARYEEWLLEAAEDSRVRRQAQYMTPNVNFRGSARRSYDEQKPRAVVQGDLQ